MVRCDSGRAAALAGALAFVMLALHPFNSAAFGGPVASGTGQTRIVFFPGLTGEPTDSTASFTFPTAGAVSSTATFNGDPGTPEIPGGPRGQGRVQYVLRNDPNAAAVGVSVLHRSFGEPSGGGGSSRFELTFTTSREMLFRYEASLNDRAPTNFESRFDDILATARFTQPLGELEGTFPIVTDENGPLFGVFTRDGLLPAGTHTLTVQADSAIGRSGFGTLSYGTVRLSLAAVPVPPAAWTGLGTLGGLAAVAAVRQVRARGRVTDHG